jgi:hypothetical protein
MATTDELRPCAVALLRVPLGNDGAAVVVEKRLAASVRRIDAAYKADPRCKAYPIRKGDTGAYNCRKTTSGSSWSKHSYGAAIDVNWSTNGYNASRHDMPAWLVALFRAEGWGWGGNWSRVKDWMHFSKFPNEGGDGKLEATSAPRQEDVMTPAQEKKLDALTAAVKSLADAIGKLATESHKNWTALYEDRGGKDAKGATVYEQHLDLVERKVDQLLEHFAIPFDPNR